jgi:hypothetical protein
MTKGFLIVFTFFLLSACKSKNVVPSGVLPQKKMQAVLWDMMRADQFLADYVLNKDTSLKQDKESINLYQQILSINKITQEDFLNSFSYYKSHPLLLKAIMDSIANAPAQIIVDTVKPQVIVDSIKPAIGKDSLKVKPDSSIKVLDSLLAKRLIKKKKAKSKIKPKPL